MPAKPPLSEKDKSSVANNLENAGHKTGCEVLGKMGFGRSCGGGSKINTGPVNTAEIEAKLEQQLNIKNGDQVNVINQETKTFMSVEPGGIVGVQGGKETTAITYHVVVPGGGSVKFGEPFYLKSQCNERFLVKDTNGEVHARSAAITETAKMYVYDVKNVGNKEAVGDFSVVGVKTYDAKWLGVHKEAGTLRADRRTINDGKAVHFSFFKVSRNHPPGACHGTLAPTPRPHQHRPHQHHPHTHRTHRHHRHRRRRC